MAIASPVGGIVSDRLVKARGQRIGRTWIAAASMLAAAAFIALGVEVRDARFASLILAGGAGALYLSQSAFWTVTSDIGGTSAGSVSGVMNMGNQIGGTITASLSPLIAEHFGWTASFLSVAAVCVVGAIAWLAVDPTQPIRTTRVGSS
jgi:ACS family glucarate transporter-like MFS transporter